MSRLLQKEDSLPLVAASIVLRPIKKCTHVLLSPRTDADFLGKYFPPGGYVDFGESIPDAAKRELREEVGLRPRRKDGYHYLSTNVHMYLYKPNCSIAFAKIYPFHIFAWNEEMGVPMNNSGNQKSWEWIPLEVVCESRGKDTRFPGNIRSIMIHTKHVMLEDKTGWFEKRGIR